jgi:hypothetical protein
MVGVTAGSAAGSAAAGSAAGPAARAGDVATRQPATATAATAVAAAAAAAADGTWQRGPQTCGVAALHRHVRDELLQVIVGDLLGARGGGSESQPCSSKAAVYELVLGEEGGSGLRHLWAVDGRESFRLSSDGQTCCIVCCIFLSLYRKVAV